MFEPWSPQLSPLITPSLPLSLIVFVVLSGDNTFLASPNHIVLQFMRSLEEFIHHNTVRSPSNYLSHANDFFIINKNWQNRVEGGEQASVIDSILPTISSRLSCSTQRCDVFRFYVCTRLLYTPDFSMYIRVGIAFHLPFSPTSVERSFNLPRRPVARCILKEATLSTLIRHTCLILKMRKELCNPSESEAQQYPQKSAGRVFSRVNIFYFPFTSHTKRQHFSRSYLLV